MKRTVLFYLIICFVACSSSRKTNIITTKKEAKKIGYPAVTASKTISEEVLSASTSSKNVSAKAQDIINTALSYNGTPYKYSGTTRSGMDCSGLVYTSFMKNNIRLERSSYLMATRGKRIKLSKVRPGDLVFFITNATKSRINHVGLVVEIKGNDIKFIHATTSRGVLISSIHEDYWGKAFVEARNIL